MSEGNVYRIEYRDGTVFTGKYVRFEKGFHIFRFDGREIGVRPSSIATVNKVEK